MAGGCCEQSVRSRQNSPFCFVIRLHPPRKEPRMGIKVACPNGHRLVVKDELAGKRGICPKCKQAFQIPRGETSSGTASPTKPAESKPSASAPAAEPKRATSKPAAASTATRQPKPERQSKTGSRGKSGAPPISQSAATAEPRSGGKIAKPPQPPGKPGGNGSSSAKSGKDVLAEAPQLAWYVRHPNGSQYGPAKGELMRQWLAEGRIGADSMAWREDWAEWQQADQVFPQLAPSTPTPTPTRKPVSANQTSVAPLGGNSAETETAGDMRLRRGRAFREKQRKMRLMVSAALLLVVIGLGVTLALVLTR